MANQNGLKQSQKKEVIVEEKPRCMKSYTHVVIIFPQKKINKDLCTCIQGMSNIVTSQGNETKRNTGI